MRVIEQTETGEQEGADRPGKSVQVRLMPGSCGDDMCWGKQNSTGLEDKKTQKATKSYRTVTGNMFWVKKKHFPSKS